MMLRIKLKFPPYDPQSISNSTDLGCGPSHRARGFVHLYYCREIFHNQYRRERPMLFRGNITRARLLIGRVERTVGVDTRRAKFLRTDVRHWMEVRPGWWLNDPMRFSLFTLLLRASRTHITIEGAMQSDHLRGTASAFRSFLSGKTHFLGAVSGTSGWGCQMVADGVGPLCLVDKDHRAVIEKARHSKKLLAAARNIAKIANSGGSNEDAILYQLSQIK